MKTKSGLETCFVIGMRICYGGAIGDTQAMKLAIGGGASGL